MAHTDFTYEAYTAMLRGFVDAGYKFAGFPEAETLLADSSPFVLMRHDIDFELEAALRIAQLDAEQGVRSTFFFLARTTFYNVFSIPGTDQVRAILDLRSRIDS